MQHYLRLRDDVEYEQYGEPAEAEEGVPAEQHHVGQARVREQTLRHVDQSVAGEAGISEDQG